MGKFFFDVRRGNTVFEDAEGVALSGLSAAWEWATRDAQDLVTQRVFPDWTDAWIEIRDVGHRQVATVALIAFA